MSQPRIHNVVSPSALHAPVPLGAVRSISFTNGRSRRETTNSQTLVRRRYALCGRYAEEAGCDQWVELAQARILPAYELAGAD